MEIGRVDAEASCDTEEDETRRIAAMPAALRAGHRRAIELFIENGMLDPLQQISNVQRFAFKKKPFLDDDNGPYELPPKHAAIVRKVKETIEANSLAKYYLCKCRSNQI